MVPGHIGSAGDFRSSYYTTNGAAMSVDHIANAVASGHAQHGIRPAGFGFLGDGSGNVVIDIANRVVAYYTVTPTGIRTPAQAYLWEKANIPLADIDAGKVIKVQLGYPYNNAPLHILGPTTEAMANAGGFTPMETKIYETQFPAATNIKDLRLVPLAGYIEAKVQTGHYTKPSTGTPYIFQDDTRNASQTLTSIQTALASGKHCIAWVFLDTENGILRTVASTATTALGTLPALNEILDTTIQSVSRPSQACKRLTPVYLYYGQTTLATSDIIYRWDMRFDVPLQAEDASGPLILSATGNFLLTATGNFLEAA